MLKSMTAYGRTSLQTSLGRFVVEIQSVNRKHLEVNTFLPKELTRFESDIRKLIANNISRGQVTLKLFAYFDRATPIVVTPNLPLARQLKSAWQTVASDLGLSETQGFSLDMLVHETGILLYGDEIKDEEQYRADICECVTQALNSFMAMRLHEGEALQCDIANRLTNLRSWMDEIAKRAPGATEKYRQKLVERLREYSTGPIENEERILREVCLYAERIDIAEEVTRFSSHLQQCDALLKSTASNIGKTFEFLLQELGREINTIGSKSSDVEVSRLVIECKSDLERIREQIQNVE